MSLKTSPRRQNREQTIARIREIAMRQLAEQGPGAISLNAIAREIGVSGPALFRYVENRDALITDLVLDAYTSFIEVMSVPEHLSPAEMVLQQGRAMRAWGLEHPHHYQLIFGTPIPGYHAPRERTREVDERLFHLMVLPYRGRSLASGTTSVQEHLADWADEVGLGDLSGAAVQQALAGWTRLHGLLSLELAGHFTTALPDAAVLYQAELETLVRWIETTD